MSRFESWTIHLSTLLVGGTGLVYAWMIYFVRPADPYAVVNHPLQPQAQHWHVLTAPLLVFAVGLIWQRHIWSHWQRGIRKGKKTGVGMMLTLVPMVASGYLIQTAVDPGWRKAWIVVHLAASALWLAGYLVHQAVPVWAWLQSLRSRQPLRGPGQGDGLAPGRGDLPPTVVHLQRRPGAAAEEPEHRRARAQRSKA